MHNYALNGVAFGVEQHCLTGLEALKVSRKDLQLGKQRLRTRFAASQRLKAARPVVAVRDA